MDPFRGSPERGIAKTVRREYERTLELIQERGINKENIEETIAILNWPLKVRGYGPVQIGRAHV